MPELFRATDYVTLPNTDGESLWALSKELRAATLNEQKRQRDLPRPVKEALIDLKQAEEQLGEVLKTEKKPDAQAELRPVNDTADDLFRGLEMVCRGWGKLAPYLEQGAIGADLHKRLFSTGMKFITSKPRQQWTETELKLGIIEKDQLGPKLERLALTQVVKLLAQVHEQYGVLIGATKPRPVQPSAQLSQAMGELEEAIRIYVLRVASMVDRKKPETKELVAMLLKPIDDLRRQTRRRRPAAAEKPAEAPAEEPAGEPESGTEA